MLPMLALLVPLLNHQGVSPTTREHISFDENWKFALGNSSDQIKDYWYGLGFGNAKAGQSEGPAGNGFNDGEWRTVKLPHDWVVELPFVKSDSPNLDSHGYKPVGRDFPETSIGWYRKTFTIPASDRGRRLSLQFDGVFRDSIVWLNGHQLAHNQSGYIGFNADITDLLNYDGKNTLSVRCDATAAEGWFYEGGGIYRHVWLNKTEPTHLVENSVFATSEVKGGSAVVTIRSTVVNDSYAPVDGTVKPSIAGVGSAKAIPFHLEPWQKKDTVQTITIPKAHLWSLEDPFMYKVGVEVTEGKSVVDQVSVNHGVRTLLFDKDKGFFLNGKHIKIRGACNHQDHAGVGSALPDRIQSYRLEQLKKYGFNAYRASHNPPTPELLDACDRLGLLVMDENRILGTSEEILGQLRRLVMRDRNHPSIFMWSLGNEEPDGMSDRAASVGRTMRRVVLELDPTRPTTYASNHGSNATGMNTVVDLRGFNYKNIGTNSIDQYRKAHPGQFLFGTEEASSLETRGIYENDPARGYVSAYDVNRPGWGALAEDWWSFFDDREWLGGAFVWTGFDYRGEPTPYQWPCINSHFGVLDTCGFPKDTAFYYQAWWSEKPVLHLFPHWNWPGKEGKTIDVWAHTNAEKVELFLNGKSQGVKTVKKNGHAEWKVVYAPGELVAKSYKGNDLLLTEKIVTTGDAATLAISPDRSEIQADNNDVSMVAISTLDSNGNHVPTANIPVEFEIEGEGRIIGVGNGDPSSHEPDQFITYPSRTPISAWKKFVVSSTENLAETGPEFDDSKWGAADVDGSAQDLKPGQIGVYRGTFQVDASKIGQPMMLNIGQCDDRGWIYLNGKLIGQTKVWNEPFAGDIGKQIKPGKNVIAIVVQNTGGGGGVGGGVSLSTPAPTPKWSRSLFNGYAQVIVQSTKTSGRIVLRAKSKGVKTAEVVIRSK